ncbi:hypothetical protein Lumi_062 [Xylophilus phage Lumi]|nr:hypothetical protein Lumi_062 [Xylophilus phage Lumi]
MEDHDSEGSESKKVARVLQIQEMVEGKSMSAEAVSRATGLSASAIRKICAEHGIKKKPGGSQALDPMEKVISPQHQKIGSRFYNYSRFEKVRSSTQLAEEIGWSVQKIASIGKGHYDLSLVDIMKIADYMNITVSKLTEGL